MSEKVNIFFPFYLVDVWYGFSSLRVIHDLIFIPKFPVGGLYIHFILDS